MEFGLAVRITERLQNANSGKLSRVICRKFVVDFFVRNEGKMRNESMGNVAEITTWMLTSNAERLRASRSILQQHGSFVVKRKRAICAVVAMIVILFMRATVLSGSAFGYCPHNHVWLAAHRTTENQFAWWVRSKPNVYVKYNMDYARWYHGEPNNLGGNENCVEMYRSFLWNDRDCNAHMCFICENRNAK